MNIVANLIARITEYYATNKRPCKVYKTEERATVALTKESQDAGTYFGTTPARFVVFYVPVLQKWTGALDYTELLARKDCTGGYIGFSSNHGFFSY